MFNCKNCNHNFSEEKGDIYKSGIHLRLDCPLCHRFIKFLPQGVNPGGVIMPFGKHKGLRIDEIHIQDTNYFKWMCEKLESQFYRGKAQEYLRNVQAPTRPIKPVNFEPDDNQQKLDF